MQRDGVGCWLQYDEDRRPCMVFYAAAHRGNNRPVCVAYLDDLYKYADDGYLWRATKEWTEILRGSYSRMEHRNLYFFTNDCLHYLLHAKPFPEQHQERPDIDFVQTSDGGFLIVGHA